VEIHVTGARGFTGTHVVRALEGLGRIEASDVDTLDITDAAAVQAAFKARPPDILVHLAALKGNKPSRDNPLEFYRVNTTGTLNLLEACRALGVKRMVFVSSLTVHGMSEEPVDENSPIRPLHPYGASKAAAEALIHAYSKSYGIEAVILRPNFIVGPIPAPQPYVDNIVYDFMTAVDTEGYIELAGDGSYQREWVHPEDVASAVRLGVGFKSGGCETFILAANRVSMKELARSVTATMGRGEVRTNPGMPGFTLVSSSVRARQVLGWKPRHEIREIVNQIWNEYTSRKSHSGHRH
jgi:UDP-glucose 4-epimerase